MVSWWGGRETNEDFKPIKFYSKSNLIAEQFIVIGDSVEQSGLG